MWTSRLFQVVYSFALFYLTFQMIVLVHPSYEPGQWNVGVFLPAGTKLISILLFGVWGAIGNFFGTIWRISSFMQGVSLELVVAFSFFGNLAQFLGVSYCVKYFKIDHQLGNLRFFHIPILAVIGSGCYAFFAVLVLLATRIIPSDGYLNLASQIFLNGLLGGLVTIAALAFGLQNFGIVRAIIRRLTS